jgi:ADP-heptose:LPS heptosyltransferase
VPGEPGRPRLVILRALGLGDLLTAVPALRALARAWPGHERMLAAPRALEPLVALIDADGAPAVDRLVGVGELEPLPLELRGADIAVNLHGCGPQSHRVLLAAAPRRVLCFAHSAVAASAEGPAWRADEHEVARWCRLLGAHGVDADPSDLRLDRTAVTGPAWARGATIVHPGAASPARRWPAERFAAVARFAHAHGARVAVTGGPGERELAATVAELAGLPGGCVHAGETDLAALAGAVAGAARVICGDTGIAHLATALGTPSVVLFGPTAPSAWGPPPSREHIVLWAGRTGDPHGREPDPGLLELTAEQALDALHRLPQPVTTP